jgi:hypothetical protein
MDKRALAEQLLGIPPGTLLDFKDYGDHVALILPDGRKNILAQSQLDRFALSKPSPQPQGSESKPISPPAARQSRPRQPRRSSTGSSPARSASHE